MKKIFSWLLFMVTVIIFIFDIYFTVYGAIDVKNQFERLEEMGRGGMEYMAVGADILAVGVVLISLIGEILSIISAKITQSRAIKIISVVLCPLFMLLILVCYILLCT